MARERGRRYRRKRLSCPHIPRLGRYLVLAQDFVHIHSRAGDLWRERFLGSGTLTLDGPPVRLDSPLSTPAPMPGRLGFYALSSP